MTEDHHLIEFPSLLLPKGVTSGSIVNIAVSRNIPEEERKMKEFWELQEAILATFGQDEPEVPVVRVKNITQTSLILEWDPLLLHTAKLRSLDIYKNGTKLAQVKRIAKRAWQCTCKFNTNLSTYLVIPISLNYLDWMWIMNSNFM